MLKTVYQWALEFTDLGISVFPVNYRQKTPKLKWEKYRSELPDPSTLKRWFLGGSLHNYGVVAGWQHLVILDFDSLDKYYAWQTWSLDQPKDSPADLAASLAFRVQTARGMHVYLSVTGAKQNAHIAGLDIKACGYVLGPGSTHPTGQLYTAQGAFVIPKIAALASLLPENWFAGLQRPPQPAPVTQYSACQKEPDPFDIASHPLRADLDLIRQIRQKHKIQDYLQNVRKTGSHYYMASCPFHNDQNPSFWVDDLRQICNCQRCHFPLPLDVINLYAKIHQIPERQAITILAHA